MNLLHIDASSLGAYSVSRELTASIVNELKQGQGDFKVTYRDVAAEPLPHWAPVMDAQSEAAALNQTVLDEFLAADVIVLGAPMYNFAIPSQLKAWIDRVLVAGKTFQYTATGPQGLAVGKRIIVASSRGGVYSSDTPAAMMDFQESYLRATLGFIGITDVQFVRAEGLAVSDDHKTRAIASAHAAIGSVAKAA
jgi:FMN-dependent NADH-azoreductase